MPRTVEISEIHEAAPGDDSSALVPPDTNGTVPTEGPEPMPSQAELDAIALGFQPHAIRDKNAVLSMLDQSIRNEAKAARKHVAWVTKNAETGKELERTYTQARQRTSRLYRMLTDGIDGRSSD